MTDASLPTATRAHVFDWLTVVLFGVVLLAPTADYLVRSDSERGPGPELRLAAPRPEAPRSLADLAAYPARYEAYWKDSFGLRDVLLRWHSALKVFVFGVSPDSTHVIGKDRWIFNDNNRIIDNWRGATPLREEELEQWKQRIERRRDTCAKIGAHYLFSLAPDKPQIYPDYLPDRYNKVGPSRMDQVFDHVRQHSDADILDLRPTLRALRVDDKPGDYVYYALGTHWQKRGALAGYNQMVAHLQPRFPSLLLQPAANHQPMSAPGGDSEARNMYIGDLLQQLQHGLMLRERRARLVTRSDQPRRVTYEIDDPSLPRVVIFHDSFGLDLEDEWSETCSRLTMVHSYDFDIGLIRSERPNLVIEFIVERSLDSQVAWVVTEHEHDPEPK